MSPELIIVVTAFMLGLMGSSHCVIMCGGFAGYLQRNHEIEGRSSSALSVSAAFNFGRLLSYSVAGVVVAYFGQSVVSVLGHHTAHIFMQLLVGGFLIIVGLNVTGWWNGLDMVEKAGARFWKLLRPLTRYLFPVNNFLRAVGAGALWGWLPCGFVYSALVLAMGAAQPLISALTMFAFGLGTIPALSTVGLMGNALPLDKSLGMRKVFGMAMVVFGGVVFTGLAMPGMTHH